ncbi:AI-2E family transporter [Janthinobacterium agaricidamnosum]|uniref:AI-2E family transporter n=1 Tax=Janthinobacterium agaricidamnosum TaxID=55508 RepID=UPI00068D7584|nr:AI-2E family transporter [Janthinobacterium agaricidamnosum]
MLGFDIRTGKIVWTTALLLLLFYMVYLASVTIVVMVFAVFFSYLVYPLVELAERRASKRIPRTVWIALVFVLVIVLAGLGVALFGSQIQAEAITLSQRLPTLINSQNVVDRIPLPDAMEPMRARIMDFVRSQIAAGTDQAMPLAKNFAGGLMHAAGNLIYIVLIPVLSFLMIKEAPAMRGALLAWLGQANRRLWGGIIDDLDVLLSKYVRALLLLSLATFIAYGIAFWLLDVPYGMLLAGLSALLEFIPFAGPLGAIVVTLVVAVFSGHEHMLWLVIFFLAYRMFQDYVVNPYLMSEGVEVSPLLVIVGLLAGDQIGGVVGIFLSVPVMAALKIVAVRLVAAKARKAAEAEQQAAPPVDLEKSAVT